MFEHIALIEKEARIGSRVTCNPAPIDTDDDRLVLTDDPEDLHNVLKGLGWECTRDPRYEHDDTSDFRTFRKGEVNLIVTDSLAFFDLFMLSTRIATELNIMNKSMRKRLFQAILYQKDFNE